MNSEEKALQLIGSCVDSKRKVGMSSLWLYLCGQGFLEAPASSETHHHNAFDGGLLDHSVRVAELLLELQETVHGNFKRYSEASCVVVGLFHDCDKVCDGFGRVTYQENVLKGGGRSDAKPYKKNKGIVKLCGAYRALLIVSRFIRLESDEMQAIAHHDYLFVPEGGIFRNTPNDIVPLTLMLHFVDMWAGIYEEGENSRLKTLEERKGVYFLE